MLMKSKNASRSPLLRKYLIKLTQRIGLVCLPQRSPTWRYVVTDARVYSSLSSTSFKKKMKELTKEAQISMTGFSNITKAQRHSRVKLVHWGEMLSLMRLRIQIIILESVVVYQSWTEAQSPSKKRISMSRKS